MDTTSTTGTGIAALAGASADTNTLKMTVTAWEGFDPDSVEDVNRIQQQMATKTQLSGWKVLHCDPETRKVTLVRRPVTTTITSDKTTKRPTKVATFGNGVTLRKSELENQANRLAVAEPGYKVTHFDMINNRATLTKMSDAEQVCREALAVVLRVPEWEVQAMERSDGGFAVKLPAVYQESKHLPGLQEAVETKIGEKGWYIHINANTLKGVIVPDALPTFPPVVDYPWKQKIPPFDLHDKNTWAKVPIGVLLDEPGKPKNRTLTADFEANPALQVSGIAGAGKGGFLMSLITSLKAHGWRVALVDAVKEAVDYVDFEPFIEPGMLATSLDEAVAVLSMAYEDGQYRKSLVKKHRVQKLSQLPTDLGVRPLAVIIDEATSLFNPLPVPKLGKDHPLVVANTLINGKKAYAYDIASKIPREQRFVGNSMILSSQVASATTGIGTELRGNLGAKILLGSKPNQQQRGMALSNPLSVPVVPDNIKADENGAARGVFVFEFEGVPPHVAKGFFAPPVKMAEWLVSQGVEVSVEDPRPSKQTVRKYLAQLEDGGAADGDDEADFGQTRSPVSGKSSAQISREMGDDWDMGEDGRRLSGFEKANMARHVSAQVDRKVRAEQADDEPGQ